MKIRLCVNFFASERYWTDFAELSKIIESMKADLSFLSADLQFTLNDENVSGDIMIAVPMSGAVQPAVLKSAENFDTVCVYPGYITGNFNEEAAYKMLSLNAAPAVMDIYGVLKLRRGSVFMCVDKSELAKAIKICVAYKKIKNSRLLLIGDTEPWVISASRDLDVYKNRLGVTIERIPIETVIGYYENSAADEAESLFGGAYEIIEPSQTDIRNALRFCKALEQLIKDKNADGAAIACFDLLNRIHTTACLAVSYINGGTDYIAACEGDTDSAVTMLMMKNLTGGGIWMANPNIQPDRTVNFVHCTAPVNIRGNNCRYRLRNHHESGIGVSPEVIFPDNLTLTSCRISGNAEKITIQKCTGRCDMRENSCRTQYRVKFADFDKYINTVLGCHQVFAFEDIAAETETLAKMLGLEILS